MRDKTTPPLRFSLPTFPGRLLQAIRLFALMASSRKQRAFNVQQFVLATEGDTFERSFASFATESRELLSRRPDSIAILTDRLVLQTAPENSLAWHYAAFMNGHGFTEFYASLARQAGDRFGKDVDRAWFRTRTEAAHDLRHVLTGYGPDVLGEACLIAFRFGQLHHTGVLGLLIMVMPQVLILNKGRGFRALREAYLRGRRADTLDCVPWEDTWLAPLETHRAKIDLHPPLHYPHQIAALAYVKDLGPG